MALSASVLGSLIDSNLASAGAHGINRTKFCDAVAKGIVESIVGQSFVTADVGVVTGAGTGIGTGVTSLDSSAMTTTALATMSRQGINAFKLMNAIMTAVVSHLSSAASLSSIDAPVFTGTGTIVIGSWSITESLMESNIIAELDAVGAHGVNAPNLSKAIATGIVTNILADGTGTLVITGSGGTPSPGTGSGTGTIT
jgi:hypothetical protein